MTQIRGTELDGTPKRIGSHDGALDVYPAAKLAGERGEDSTTGADYKSVAGEWATTGVIAAGAGGTVYGGPCILHGVWVEVTIGTAAPTITDGGTTRRTLPIALPIGYHQLGDIIFETDCVVVAGASATGSLRFDWRPLDPRVTWPY